jgi:hypothetical protein
MRKVGPTAAADEAWEVQVGFGCDVGLVPIPLRDPAVERFDCASIPPLVAGITSIIEAPRPPVSARLQRGDGTRRITA